jgi:hypothetical protein
MCNWKVTVRKAFATQGGARFGDSPDTGRSRNEQSRGCDREEWRLIEDSASQGSGPRLDRGEFGTLLDPCSKLYEPRLAQDQNPI